MINAIDSTLYKAPEALNGIGMGRTDDILPIGMIATNMTESSIFKSVVNRVFIGIDDGFLLHVLSDKGHNCGTFDVSDRFNADFPMSFCNTDHWNFVGTFSRSALVVAMPFTANVSFVNLNLIRKYASIFIKKCADLPEHTPCGLIGYAMLTLKCFGRKARSSSRHFVNSIKPYMKGCRGLAENRVGKWGYLSSAVVTFINRLLRQPVMLRNLIADWAMYAFGPQVIFNPFKTSIIVREMYGKILRCELLHLILFHGFYPSLEYSIAGKLRDVKG